MAKQKKASKAAPKRKSVSTKAARPSKKKSSRLATSFSPEKKTFKRTAKPSEAEVAWKTVFIQGESIHKGAIEIIHKGVEVEDVNGGRIAFDFGHFIPSLETLCARYPNCNFFVFGGTPESFNLASTENNPIKDGIHPVPTINVIAVPKGFEVPSLVAIRDFQHGTQEIKAMSDLNLVWNHAPSWATEELEGRISILACTARMTKTSFKTQSDEELYKFEYASLFFMRPSVDWQKEERDPRKLSIRNAVFTYGDFTEKFDRDTERMSSFVPDFLERNDLGGEHEEPVKDAIKSAFEHEREVKQKQVDLFDGYDADVLESMEAVLKLYPKNAFIANANKSARVNEYYGNASLVV